ncbi:MAG: class I SAM-dependent methyltransferase [Flavobacteriales bacterium]|nr:class I SAM-dependent methyltransferase [Flavobacteriales bacterium]
MYEKVKKIAKQLIPKQFIKKHEDKLRGLVALSYRGNNVTCTVCDQSFSKFIQLDNNDLLCPNCGSLPRTRRLVELLECETNLDRKKVLHFSPPKGLRRKLNSLEIGSYITTDYEGEFDADKRLNIEAIEEADQQYDIIICYHVLEHIIKDEQAMGELYRILKPNGVCFIQTPFKTGEIYEDYTITSKAGRLEHFGQDDHVRIYSVEGLKGRLVQQGFMVEVLAFEEPQEHKKGLVTEVVLKAIKK